MTTPLDNMINTELAERIARTWVVISFPHKEWPLISAEEQGRWLHDVVVVMDAIHKAGLAVVEAEDGR